MARKTMSQAHKDKIAAGVRKHHAKCRQNGAVKKTVLKYGTALY